MSGFGNSGWEFGDLDLSGVEAQRASRSLKPGPHLCRTSDAEMTKTKAGGRQLKVQLNDVDGSGHATDYISLTHPKQATDEGAKLSVRIGMERLKALLTFGGHPTPDAPGDIKSINGLIVGVNIEQGDDWEDDKGVTRKGGGKPAKSGCYFKPDASMTGKTEGAGASTQSRRADGDSIPF